jgi:hypothetical protein
MTNDQDNPQAVPVLLHLSPQLSLPLDFVTSTQVILAKKGSGKSYTASVLAEELLDARQQVVVIDPTGAWYGLRSSADGRASGYSIAVIGGEHADVPLESTAGEVIAEAIAAEHFSAIVDVSLLRKNDMVRFLAAFLETLYRTNRDALHLIIDEADEGRLLGATEDIVRRGRIRGIGCTLITQRPQVLNKNVLSQVDMLTALRMNHPKDLGAIDEWVAVHGDPDQATKMLASLPSLPIGQAWLWAPAHDVFERVTIRRRRTFDSGRTPKAGERTIAPKVLAPVDLTRLGAAIASTVERAKAESPKALHARIAELEKQLGVRRGATSPATVVERIVEKPVLAGDDVRRLEHAIDRGSPRTTLSDRPPTEVSSAAAATEHEMTMPDRSDDDRPRIRAIGYTTNPDGSIEFHDGVSDVDQRRVLAERERQLALEGKKRELWGPIGPLAMSRLAKMFPSLRGVAGVEPWHVDELLTWLCTSPAVTSGSHHAAMFVLGVWNTSTDWSEVAQELPRRSCTECVGLGRVDADEGYTVREKRPGVFVVSRYNDADELVELEVKTKRCANCTGEGTYQPSLARGRFDVFAAMSVWDAEHVAAFRMWVEYPFWP